MILITQKQVHGGLIPNLQYKYMLLQTENRVNIRLLHHIICWPTPHEDPIFSLN